jgi:hypothetical protein
MAAMSSWPLGPLLVCAAAGAARRTAAIRAAHERVVNI